MTNLIKTSASQRIARKRGRQREGSLLAWLRWAYYDEYHFRIGKWKDVYDIYSDKILIDVCGVDDNNRLICDHKQGCRKHRRQSKDMGLPGYLAFEWQGYYYFLSVYSKIVNKRGYVRPKVTPYVIRSCVTNPIRNDKTLPIRVELEKLDYDRSKISERPQIW